MITYADKISIVKKLCSRSTTYQNFSLLALIDLEISPFKDKLLIKYKLIISQLMLILFNINSKISNCNESKDL